MRGPLFESFVVSEFIKTRYNQGIPSYFYFWRDRSGNEVDLLLEQEEKLKPIEIKSGKTLNLDYFNGLKKWLALAESAAINPTLIYGGGESAKHAGIRVMSWRDRSAFKN